MWELGTALAKDMAAVNTFLEDGYEPFAVTSSDVYQTERVWLKREVDIETHNKQPRANKRASRRAAPKSKG